jgi:hypothetical protein
MASENPMGQGTSKCLTTYEEERREQEAVLRRVLEIYPQTLTLDELIRDLTAGGSKEFGEIDAVQRAVRDLAAAGLLHPLGADEIIRPTRAALRYFELTERAA